MTRKSARFSGEGYQEPQVAFVKTLTTKPVVSVGRFTSPDVMVSQIRRGIQDFIGAARPSIADPFLPTKIRDGREDEIRECIGCNICRAANNEGVHLRCTQNPTIARGMAARLAPGAASPPIRSARRCWWWAPDPPGLEAALSLGRRGLEVTLADRNGEAGRPHAATKARLPGLATWIRVRDWRQHMIAQAAERRRSFPAAR